MSSVAVKKNRKRGSNYTAVEKEILLDLVNRNLKILENKETSGDVVREKKQCWLAVTQKFNTFATTGLRTWQQLRHLYENIKHKTRKNGAAELNKSDYFTRKELYDRDKASSDKMIMVPVSCDNNIVKIGNVKIEPSIYSNETNDNNTVENGNVEIEPYTFSTEIDVEIPQPECILPEENTEPFQIKTRGDRVMKKAEIPRRYTNVKEEYFKTKLANARLERKCMLEKHKLEMELLKIKIKRFRK